MTTRESEIRNMSGAERNHLAKYLAEKLDRTLDETLQLLQLRLDADQTKPDARLMIVYGHDGALRRVLINDLTGRELCEIVSSFTAAREKLKTARESAIRECAKVALDHADHEAAAGNRARTAGRFGVGSHRDAGVEVATAIALKIAALQSTPTETT